MIEKMAKKFDWKKIIEEVTETKETVFLDPTKMSSDERHDLIEGLYVDYMYFLAQKKPPLKILKNYKMIISELVKNFAH